MQGGKERILKTHSGINHEYILCLKGQIKQKIQLGGEEGENKINNNKKEKKG